MKQYTVILSRGASVISRRIRAESAKAIMDFFRDNEYWVNFIFEGFPEHEGEKNVDQDIPWLKPITLEEFAAS